MLDNTRLENISTFLQKNFVIAWKIGQNSFLCPSYRLFCKQPAPRALFVPEKLLICQVPPPFTESVCSLPWARSPLLQYVLLQIKPVSTHILLLYILLIIVHLNTWVVSSDLFPYIFPDKILYVRFSSLLCVLHLIYVDLTTLIMQE